MNDNVGKPAGFVQKREEERKNRAAAVIGSAMEEIAPDEPREESPTTKEARKRERPLRGTPEKVIDSAIESVDSQNISVTRYARGDASLESRRHSSIVFDMDIYMTLTDLKRMKRLSIHKYCCEAIRERLRRDFPADLERNTRLLGK